MIYVKDKSKFFLTVVILSASTHDAKLHILLNYETEIERNLNVVLFASTNNIPSLPCIYEYTTDSCKDDIAIVSW